MQSIRILPDDISNESALGDKKDADNKMYKMIYEALKHAHTHSHTQAHTHTHTHTHIYIRYAECIKEPILNILDLTNGYAGLVFVAFFFKNIKYF